MANQRIIEHPGRTLKSGKQSACRLVHPDRAAVEMGRCISGPVLRHAIALAREVGARAVLALANAIEGDKSLVELARKADVRLILIRRASTRAARTAVAGCDAIDVPDVHMTRTGQVKTALLVCLAKGLVQRADCVVCLTGIDGSGVIDTCLILDLATEPELFSAVDGVPIGGDVTPEVFERTLTLATQLAREGREGRPVGAIFVIGDSERVLEQSRSLVLNPFHGYPESERNILDPKVEDTIKEFSAIDGAFVVRGNGVVLASGVQLVPRADAPQLLNGLGTRHAAAAAITASTDAVAIVISQSTGTISVFKSGQLITDLHRPATSHRLAS